MSEIKEKNDVIKQTNFRIGTDTAEEFRQFCVEHGFNQAQGMDHLMQVLALNEAKAGLTGRLVEIENFEAYIKKITEAYLTSLQVAKDTEDRVKENFATDISLRDKALMESEKKNANLNKKIEELITKTEAAVKQMEADSKEKENAVKQMETSVQMAHETKKVNTMLMSEVTELKGKLLEYPKLKETAEKLRSEITKKQHECELLESDLKHIKEDNVTLAKAIKESNVLIAESNKTISSLKEEVTSVKRDLLEKEREQKQAIEENKKELEQAKALAKAEAVIEANKQAQVEMDVLKEQNTRLKMRLELLEQAKPQKTRTTKSTKE